MKLIEIFEYVHQAGFIFNDLKLDNILVGDFDQETEIASKIRLIDFGLVTSYLDDEGKHL